MEWYSGTIPEAIKLAKDRKVLFVVYISGKLDDMSKEMDKSWDSTSVIEASTITSVVAIRIDADSDTCTQFSAIFPVVVIPATYFIGNDGVPIEVSGGSKSEAELSEMIHRVSKMHSDKIQSAAGRQASHSPGIAGNGQAQYSGGAFASSSSQRAVDVAKHSPATEEKAEKAQELINQKRALKSQKEKEEEKVKEKERRGLGKNLVQLKEWKAEQENKEIQDKMRKDKEENKLAKERVKEQIARDREERKKRYQQETSKHENTKELKRIDKLKAEQEAKEKLNAERSLKACIQFRMADGSYLTHQFASTDTLGSAQQFLVDSLSRGPETFRMCLAYPRREFSANDMSQSLADLGLSPSASVMILPPPADSRVVRSTGNQSFFNMILAPFFMIWDFIYSFLFSRGQEASTAHSSQDNSQKSEGPTNSRKRPAPGSNRREGNIHRLKRDDDDDMNTWNGNSTQQM